MATNNYLKVLCLRKSSVLFSARRTWCVFPKNTFPRFEAFLFFFDDKDIESRRAAYNKALALAENNPSKISICYGNAMGRYPKEKYGEAHPVVKNMAPISDSVRVVGYCFEHASHR